MGSCNQHHQGRKPSPALAGSALVAPYPLPCPAVHHDTAITALTDLCLFRIPHIYLPGFAQKKLL